MNQGQICMPDITSITFLKFSLYFFSIRAVLEYIFPFSVKNESYHFSTEEGSNIHLEHPQLVCHSYHGHSCYKFVKCKCKKYMFKLNAHTFLSMFPKKEIPVISKKTFLFLDATLAIMSVFFFSCECSLKPYGQLLVYP